MNLVIIGKDVDQIALKIWEANTNYYVLNHTPYMWSSDFLKFIDKKDVIVATTSDQFAYKDVNDVLELFIEKKFIPILISEEKNSLEENMYTFFEDFIPESILYTRNKDNKDFDEMIKMAQNYLLGKGLSEKNDKTVRTPRKRKRTSSKA